MLHCVTAFTCFCPFMSSLHPYNFWRKFLLFLLICMIVWTQYNSELSCRSHECITWSKWGILSPIRLNLVLIYSTVAVFLFDFMRLCPIVAVISLCPSLNAANVSFMTLWETRIKRWNPFLQTCFPCSGIVQVYTLVYKCPLIEAASALHLTLMSSIKCLCMSDFLRLCTELTAMLYIAFFHVACKEVVVVA